jgi:hypothetical protein
MARSFARSYTDDSLVLGQVESHFVDRQVGTFPDDQLFHGLAGVSGFQATLKKRFQYTFDSRIGCVDEHWPSIC